MNYYGMMVDISHPSKEAIRQTIKHTKSPVIASHSSARHLSDHPRNLDDEQLKWIKENGGVVQVVALDEFLNKTKHEAHLENPKLKVTQLMKKLATMWKALVTEEKDAIVKEVNALKEKYKEEYAIFAKTKLRKWKRNHPDSSSSEEESSSEEDEFVRNERWGYTGDGDTSTFARIGESYVGGILQPEGRDPDVTAPILGYIFDAKTWQDNPGMEVRPIAPVRRVSDALSKENEKLRIALDAAQAQQKILQEQLAAAQKAAAVDQAAAARPPRRRRLGC